MSQLPVCPHCGTQMVNCGAPIWEDYCPNKACTGQRDEFFQRLRETAAKTKAANLVRDAAPDLLAASREMVMHVNASQVPAEVIDAMRAAIAKAEGRT